MLRLWIGIALLAGSWLLGIDYFYPASSWAWLTTVAVAVVLLGRLPDRPLAASETKLERLALVLLLPAVWYASWPYRVAPLLIVLGLAIRVLRIRPRWAEWLASGSMAAGVVLLVQSVALEFYVSQTARSHELPWPLPNVLAGLATALGIDAAASGSSVVMHSLRQVHRLGATWELFLDPATFLFFVGGATVLALRRSDECGMMNDELRVETPVSGSDESVHHSSFIIHHLSAWSAWIRGLRVLALIAICWLPLRSGLLMAVYLQRTLRSDPDRPLHVMNHFFSPWMLLLLLAVPALLAWRFTKRNDECGMTNDECPEEAKVGSAESVHHSSSVIHHLAAVCALFALSIALFTAAIYWDPVGARREGRVMVVERHSTWEPTTNPYDTNSFGELSGYNYAAIYDYLAQFFQMSRLLEDDKIDEQTLAGCDVLVIKNPSTRYSQAEIDAVTNFVKQGGGLLLLGDHTNFERSSTILNDITRPMGFIFRDDLLFGFGESPYDEHYSPPPLSHPIVQNIPPFDFAVSCSIDPGSSRGRAAIVNTGLWSMGPEYHHDNYHPFPQHCPEMRYGAFIQEWAARFGQGRAVAFTDSTIFSNFCVFQPGKAELMLGMVEWLNRANPPLNPRPWLLLLGLACFFGALWIGTDRCANLPSPGHHEVVDGRGAGGEGGSEAVLLAEESDTLSSLLKKGTGSEPISENLAKNNGCEVPVPLFQQAVSPRRHGDGTTVGTSPLADVPSAAKRVNSGREQYDVSREWLLVLAAGTCGWVLASFGVSAVQSWAMPIPECVRPMTRVVIDRTTSNVPLSKGADTQGNGDGYGLLEQWIARTGCYTIREEGPEVFSGDAIVVICPSRSVSPEFRTQLIHYVAAGGRLLVIDSPENVGSTANSLLSPFGLSIHRDRAWKGKLTTTAALPSVDVAGANEVAGGKPLGMFDKLSIIATAKHEKGSVMAIGCGSLWNDKQMGEHWMLDPDAAVKARYDVLFALLRLSLDDKPLPTPPPQPVKKPPVELPMKESGPAEM